MNDALRDALLHAQPVAQYTYEQAQRESSWAWITVLTIILAFFIFASFETAWKDEFYLSAPMRGLLRAVWIGAVGFVLFNVVIMLVTSYIAALS